MAVTHKYHYILQQLAAVGEYTVYTVKFMSAHALWLQYVNVSQQWRRGMERGSLCKHVA